MNGRQAAIWGRENMAHVQGIEAQLRQGDLQLVRIASYAYGHRRRGGHGWMAAKWKGNHPTVVISESLKMRESLKMTERMIQHLQNPLLSLRPLNFVLQCQFFFIHHFHGLNTSPFARAGAPETAEINVAKVATPDTTEKLEISKVQAVLSARRSETYGFPGRIRQLVWLQGELLWRQRRHFGRDFKTVKRKTA